MSGTQFRCLFARPSPRDAVTIDVPGHHRATKEFARRQGEPDQQDVLYAGVECRGRLAQQRPDGVDIVQCTDSCPAVAKVSSSGRTAGRAAGVAATRRQVSA